MITREAWENALAQVETYHLEANDPDSLTSSELSELWGCSPCTARLRAEKLVKAGLAERASKRVFRSLNNGTRSYPAYKLVKGSPHADAAAPEPIAAPRPTRRRPKRD